MELLELSATDFCCFSSFTLKLKKAGLVWITGRNKDTKSADNNGSGKCIPLDAPILMSDGSWRKLKNVRVGDWVMAPDFELGKCVPAPVLATTKAGKKKVYKLNFSDGGYVIASKNHEFPMWLYSHGRFEKRTVERLLKKYKDPNKIITSMRAKLKTLPIRYPKRDLKVEPYLIGVLLGDGTCDTPGMPGYHVTSVDSEIIEYCRTQAEKFGFELKNCKNSITYKLFTRRYKPHSGGNDNYWGEPVQRILDFLGLRDKKADTKKIPPLYLRSSIKQRKELLAGLVDTDGYVGQSSIIELSTRSEELKNGYVELFYSLGGRAKGYLRKDGLNWRIFGHLPIDCILPLKIKRKREVHVAKAKKGLDYSRRIITDIEYLGKKKCGDLQIGHRDRCFVSYDYVVTGNSTIFKALTWALYGKTVDGERGDGVIKDGATRATVCVLIGDRNSTYKVTRIRKVGSPMLKLSRDGAAVKLPKKELQARIDSLLGLDYQAFKNTVFYGQNDSSRFADPKTRDSERKGVLHKILGLGILKLCHEETRRRRLARRKDLTAVETKIEAQKARIEEQNLDELRKEMKQFERIRQHELERIQRKIDSVVEELHEKKNDGKTKTRLEKEIKALKKKNKGLKEQNKAIAPDIHLLGQSEATFDNQQKELEIKIKKAKATLNKVGSNISVLEEQLSLLDGSNCPVCSSKIAKGSARKHKAELKRRFETYKEDIVGLHTLIKNHKKTRKSIIGNRDVIRDKISKSRTLLRTVDEVDRTILLVENMLVKIKQNELTIEKDCAKKQIELTLLKTELKKAENEENPYIDLLKKALEKARLYIAQLKTLKKKRQKVVFDLANIEYWFRGFSNQGLPSFVLDGVMPILTDRANHYLGVLTDGDIIVDFSTQREKKATKGEMRDEIVINWTIEDVTGYPPSGGQLKKIEIATDLALMDLAVSNGGKAPDILCLDEILDGLDEKGVQRVLLLLQNLRRKRGSIFVISHDDRMSEIFERSIVVKKKNGVSKLRVVG